MCLFKKIDNEYKSMSNYGITFGIVTDDKLYPYDAPDNVEITFGHSEQECSCGQMNNYQMLYLNGKAIGYLHEWCDNLLKPICVSFRRVFADCQQPDFYELYERYKGYPHFHDDGESISWAFATINQLLEFLQDPKGLPCGNEIYNQ